MIGIVPLLLIAVVLLGLVLKLIGKDGRAFDVIVALVLILMLAGLA